MTDLHDFPQLMTKLKTVEGLTLRENEPLAPHLSMGVGGPARIFALVEAEQAIAPLVRELTEAAVPWFVLGGGSNTLADDSGFQGVVLSLGRAFRKTEAGPELHQITVGAATPLSAVMNFAKRRGLSGLEWAAGIPGEIGGALAGNAGTAQGDTCSLIERVEVVDRQGNRLIRHQGEFEFGYRYSTLRRDVILSATFTLTPDTPEAIENRIKQALEKRWEQPIGVRCSGCMFKNPQGDYAGRLIDQAGLKGLRVGGVQVSDKHANFFINDAEASAGDLFELIDKVRRVVRDKTGVELELEIRTVGLDSPR